jgi:hypothetical protein
MGEAARQRVEKLFTIEAAATGIREATLRVYQHTKPENRKVLEGKGQISGARKEAGLEIMSSTMGRQK